MNITHAEYLAPDMGIAAVVDLNRVRVGPTKKYLLDLGIAIMRDEADEHPWADRMVYHLPKEPGRSATNITGGTDNPVVVCLARRYWLACNNGTYRPGPVPVPTMEEAQRESAAWKKGI